MHLLSMDELYYKNAGNFIASQCGLHLLNLPMYWMEPIYLRFTMSSTKHKISVLSND